MKVISLLAQKGGTGKSTLAAHFAVEAERALGPVVLVDLDPQASLRRWYAKRRSETPIVVDHVGHGLGDVLRECRDYGAGLVVIDTAPHIMDTAVAAAVVADLVVIPTRAGSLDIEAIDATVDVVRGVNAEAVVVLNAVRPRGTLTAEAREALEVYGLPICPVAIVHRAALADALIDGRGVQELDPRGKGADEIRRVWSWIRRRL